MDVPRMLQEMRQVYIANPVKAVRGQGFIRILHGRLDTDLTARLTNKSRRRDVKVKKEAQIFGSHKPKAVDVSVIDPDNGPLMMVGIRSQMSSVGNNALTYYEGIIRECISLQDRFPMAVVGYVYLMPLHPIKEGEESEVINHTRYSRLYDAITGRGGQAYKDIRGIYDEFAYMIVDFAQNPPVLRDDLFSPEVEHDLRISTFVDRMITTFKRRHLFLDVFT